MNIKMKWIYLMGTALFLLAALSHFRLWFIGTPNLDGLPMIIPWEIVRRTIIFSLISCLGIGFLKLLSLKLEVNNLKKLLICSIILQFIAVFTLPLTSNDIFSNLAYGKMSFLGLDVNHLGASALPLSDPFRQMVTSRWMEMPIVYGPVIGWLNRLIVMPNNLWGSIIVYKLFALILSIGITVIVYLFCKNILKGQTQCNSFILFALNPAFLWEFSSQAHNDAIMIMGTVGFVYFLSQDKDWQSLLSIIFAFITKLAVLPVLGLYFCWTFFNSKKRFLLYFLIIVLCGIFSAYYFSEKFWMILVPPSSSHGIDVTRLTSTPLFLIHKFFGPIGYKIYWLIAMAFMGILGIIYAWHSRTKEQLFLYSFLFILLFNLIATPTYQPWYITWLLPFIIVINDIRLRKFFAIYSVISMAQYAILNSTTGSIINICILIMFWQLYLKKTQRKVS